MNGAVMIRNTAIVSLSGGITGKPSVRFAE